MLFRSYIANDAVAKAGAGMKEVETTHRVEPSAEIAEITQAGFVLDGQSDILRNKTDDHTAAMNNPEARDKADRFLLRFKKPANASNSDHRPKTGLGALADNTLVWGSAKATRHAMFDKSGIYREFGLDMIPSWAITGIGIELDPVQFYAGKWFHDADGHLCRRQEYPLVYRGFINCAGVPANAAPGQSFEVTAGDGAKSQGQVLRGIVYPKQ